MVVPYLGTLAWIRSLNFTVIHLWRPWLVDGEIAGLQLFELKSRLLLLFPVCRYSRKHSNNFTFATVKGGGHTAPEYKPKECFAMFKRWISQDPL
ncbi:hypothetical protein PRUPE_6G218800 [Prunus persica]|uniref:Uncharacterized protein n=1 Tax=Prunus persica TaxID=3760 RepID=A0A251NTR9_PRUPE|nr:hypothetical protein PRUPE_6G218800 [Prunus persica]